MPKEPEVPTTSPEPCGLVATPREAASAPSSTATDNQPAEKAARSKKINWDKVKVFAKPEYRLPYKLTKYMQGKKPENSGEPELWLQVAIESGLVEMGSLHEDGRVRELLEPIDGAPKARASRADLEMLLAKGIADALGHPGFKDSERK